MRRCEVEGRDAARVRCVVDQNTAAIVAMAWARTCGLPDDAFAAGSGRLHARADGDAITIVQLLGRTLVHGPEWVLELAESYSDESLIEVHGLLTLARDHQPRATKVSSLMYADDYIADGSLEQARVTDDEQAVRDLLVRCAPDDADLDSLLGYEHRFVVLAEDDDPQAAAAYSARQEILADLVVVDAIDARGNGSLQVAAALAMHDALDAGLIPQLRIGVDDSHDLADSLGFTRLGALATVFVDP